MTSRTARPRPSTGRVLISLVAAAAPLGAVAADWNTTHVHNPRWPPHAKFHNAQTMLSAFQLAGLSLWQLWTRPATDRSALRWGTLLAALYWLSQAPAVLLPGAALTDPELSGTPRRIAGIPVDQLTGQAVLIWPALVSGYLLEHHRLTRSHS